MNMRHPGTKTKGWGVVFMAIFICTQAASSKARPLPLQDFDYNPFGPIGPSRWELLLLLFTFYFFLLFYFSFYFFPFFHAFLRVQTLAPSDLPFPSTSGTTSVAFPTFAPATHMDRTQKSAFIVAVAFLSISLATSVIFNVFFFARWLLTTANRYPQRGRQRLVFGLRFFPGNDASSRITWRRVVGWKGARGKGDEKSA